MIQPTFGENPPHTVYIVHTIHQSLSERDLSDHTHINTKHLWPFIDDMGSTHSTSGHSDGIKKETVDLDIFKDPSSKCYKFQSDHEFATPPSSGIISGCSHLQRALAALRYFEALNDNELFADFCVSSYGEMTDDMSHMSHIIWATLKASKYCAYCESIHLPGSQTENVIMDLDSIGFRGCHRSTPPVTEQSFLCIYWKQDCSALSRNKLSKASVWTSPSDWHPRNLSRIPKTRGNFAEGYEETDGDDESDWSVNYTSMIRAEFCWLILFCNQRLHI